MEDWVLRALARWPNVPALYGWLQLDRRGRWRIRGEAITRPQIIDTINRNYEADGQGRWFFQNGPQRGYVQLETAPLVLRSDAAGGLLTHTGLPVNRIAEMYLDESGAVLLATEHGPGAISDADLGWILGRLHLDLRLIDEDDLMAALAHPSGTITDLTLAFGPARVAVMRLDAVDAPQQLGFVRDPQPDASDAGIA